MEKLYKLLAALETLIVIGIAVFLFGGYWKILPAGFAPSFDKGHAPTSINTGRATVGMTRNGSAVASSTQVLAANAERFYARIQNVNTDGLMISCTLGNTATSSVANAIILAPISSTTPNSIFEIDTQRPFTGAVYCYAQATSTIEYYESY